MNIRLNSAIKFSHDKWFKSLAALTRGGLKPALSQTLATLNRESCVLKVYFCVIILFLSFSAYGMEWGEARFAAMGMTQEIKSPNKKITLAWQERMIPGEDILMLSTEYLDLDEKFYHRYKFSGVHADSAKIVVTGSYQSKGSGSSQKSESMNQVIFVERATDGAFYFIPQDLKNNGVVIIKRDDKYLGMYAVEITRIKNN